MADLTTMPNIGKEMENKLNSVGISTAEELTELGAKETFFRLKMQYPQVCLVHLYALEGAIEGIGIDSLAEKTKADLKEFSDSLK